MVDKVFTDTRLAALYDLFSPADGRADFEFYLPLVMSARSVLDLGCGTGTLLHRARAAGHTGRLCGVDPAPGMLEVARSRADIEWVLGDIAAVRDRDRQFDLVVMTGHAFQALVDDDELRSTVATVAAVLRETGSFVFETRNPAVREWETWDRRYSGEVTDDSGAVVRCVCEVLEPVAGDLVSFTHTFSSAGWARPEVSHSTLRFLDSAGLAELLCGAGLIVAEQFGDWDRRSPAPDCPEIITVARHPRSQA
ncbi:putative methyltransferase [Nocardia brasiliensis NBRC 14402]|uniref:class I SAM-dependent DNA methyltransferase n=1 Tax=Nocardia brasiliensis TaxID=37326 RepID=UPI0002EA38C0|nr:class I SAM-dependent methyltransferase [Nocardia brasiliensis]ASF06691.1 class I SAM-dependent methyltransferase [Nocardia brasiliensis]GAJ84056.1 putative methyltransferase [Nocardia brasiliensis NBRC 14402]SUB48131.1 Glycine/sarcosine N-methyltransferase [Nocardia brasiliensis]